MLILKGHTKPLNNIFYPLSLPSSWNLQTPLVSCRQIQLDNRILLLVVIEEGTIKYNIRTPSEWKLQWMVLGRDAWKWKSVKKQTFDKMFWEPIFCRPTLPVFIFVCKFIKCFSFPEFCTARCRPYFVKILKINIGSGYSSRPVQSCQPSPRDPGVPGPSATPRARQACIWQK